MTWKRAEDSEATLWRLAHMVPWYRIKFCNFSGLLFWLKFRHGEYWIDASEITGFTPDFYSDRYPLMADVMQVTECTHYVQSGKKLRLINPALAEEMQQIYQRAKAGVYGQLDGLAIGTAAPSHDRNYQFWLDEFIRVTQKHNEYIPQYRQNHPEFQTAFFIYDDSLSYSVFHKPPSRWRRYRCFGLHKWWRDKAFIDAIWSLDCEYVIWFAIGKGWLGERYQMFIANTAKRKPRCLKAYNPAELHSIPNAGDKPIIKFIKKYGCTFR